jgi:hypothetical protein
VKVTPDSSEVPGDEKFGAAVSVLYDPEKLDDTCRSGKVCEVRKLFYRILSRKELRSRRKFPSAMSQVNRLPNIGKQQHEIGPTIR